MSTNGYILADPEKGVDKAQLDYAASSSDSTESPFEFTAEEERVIGKQTFLTTVSSLVDC